MAKGKHSTALFEVINSGKKPPGGLKSSTGKPLEGKAAAASLMRTPKWWFKGLAKPKPDAAPRPSAPVVNNDPTANVTAATLTGWRPPVAPNGASAASTSPGQARSTTSTSAPDTGSTTSLQADSTSLPEADSCRAVPVAAPAIAHLEPDSEPSVVARDDSGPEPIVAEEVTDPETEAAPAADTLTVFEPDPAPFTGPIVKTSALTSRRETSLSRSAVHFDVDRNRQEIILRMRYTTAIVSGFAVLVMIATAYVVGRHLGESASFGSGTAINHPTSGQIKSGPAQPGVLNVGRDRAHLASARIDGSAPPAAKAVDADAYEDAPVDAAGIAYRTVNRNYVIIDTFPSEKSDIASKACDFLCNHGITCTLERDVHGEPPHWLSIVGTRGFPHRYSTNKDYLAYHDQILALNEKFPAKSNFGHFSVLPYKWDGN